MKFDLDEELHEFTEVLDRVLAKSAGATGVRPFWDEPTRPGLPTFEAVGSTGVTGLTVPEEYGGSGCSFADSVAAIETLGRWIVPEPLAETIGVVVPTLSTVGTMDGIESILTDVAAGTGFCSVQPSWEGWAPWAVVSLAVLVPDGDDVAVVDPAGHVEPLESVDPARRVGRVSSEARRIATINGAAPMLRHRAVVTSALQLYGLAAGMLAQAVAYSLERVQFGRMIGSYQALKHQMADAYSAIENGRRSAWWAAWCIESDRDAIEESTALAKATAGETARLASRVALQVHGGIGYTWDCDLHLWMKRALILDGSWGTTDDHWAKLTEIYWRDGA